MRPRRWEEAVSHLTENVYLTVVPKAADLYRKSTGHLPPAMQEAS